MSSASERPQQRVVITGMGAMTPIGCTLDSFWDNLVAGRSGTGIATLMQVDDLPVKVVAEVKDFRPEVYMDAAVSRCLPRFSQLALAAAGMALEDSAVDLRSLDRARFGCEIGSGQGGFKEIAEEIQRYSLVQDGLDGLSPWSIIHPASVQLAAHFGLQGPNNTDSTACAASTQALGNAFRILQRGDADVMLAGGTEANFTRFALAAFTALRALSSHNDEPDKASRPFDLTRDGFVGGEGAGMLILETLEHASSRRARIYAEVVGFAVTDDAFHVVMPLEDGSGPARAMSLALRDAGLSPEDVDYINAHGTATPLNDRSETIAIKRAFGDHAYRVPISSTKSMIGHLIGASGAVEAIATALSMGRGIIHPTINLHHPDPDCDLDYVPNEARPKDIRVAMSNSFGFGGQNACLVFERFDG